jgi:hypothetical protein
MINPRAFRWTALAEELSRRGIRVSVVCSWIPGLPAIENRNGVEVHRVGMRWLETLRAVNATRRDAAAQLVQPNGEALRSSRVWSWRQTGPRALTRLWHMLYWPDTSCLWFVPARSVVQRLQQRSPGMAVVSVSPAFTAVAVAYSLHRKSKLLGRWLIDLGDPFCCAEQAPPNNIRIYNRLNYAFERRSFTKADSIAVTNEALSTRYRKLFPESADKISVIPPLLSLSKQISYKASPENTLPDAPRCIIYLGTLYPTIRRPDFLLALFFAAMERSPRHRLELHFYGSTHQCIDSFAPYRDAIGLSLFLHGTVPHPQAIKAIASAAALVNISNNSPHQLPSKLVEYVATEKPIINLFRTADDCSIEFLRGYPGTLDIEDSGGPPSPEQVDSFLRFVLAENRPPCAEKLSAWLDPYRLGRIASGYEALLFPSAIDSHSATPE